MNTKPVVKMRVVVLCCVFLLTTSLSARESTDVIVMKNGDHLTGKIKGLNAGVLYNTYSEQARFNGRRWPGWKVSSCSL